MRYLCLALAIFCLAGAASADSRKDCQDTLAAIGEIQILTKQAKYVSDIQKAVATLCDRLVKAEKDLADAKKKEAPASPAETPVSTK